VHHIARSIVLISVFAALGFEAAAAQATESAQGIFRARISALAPGAWIASNAEYREVDGGIDRFGLDWDLVPGGNAARGCLWGVTSGTETAFWEFLFYWDPAAEQAVLYQASPAGAIAVGAVDPTRPESEMMSQILVQPNGSRREVGHTTRLEGADVRIDRSFQRAVGTTEWAPGRTYRWERQQGDAAPCWG
jgi:hypothetical protein